MTDRDDRSFFIAVKVIETGRQGRFGSWWNGGIEQVYSHMSVFFAKRAKLRDFGAVTPLFMVFVLIHL